MAQVINMGGLAGSLPGGYVRTCPSQLDSNNYATAGSGSAKTVTLAAVNGKRYIIRKILFGYAATPTSGLITVQYGSGPTTAFSMPVTASGIGFVPLDEITTPQTNQQVIVTLADGTA